MAFANSSPHQTKSLKESVHECITGILSSTDNIRTSAEERMQILSYTEEFGVHLAEIAMCPNEDSNVRQLASVLLKQYIETHWSNQSEKFRTPEVSEFAKTQIKEILPTGLSDPNSKLRSSVAYAISSIAHWDWPENWPELFNVLGACLAGNDDTVHGAMRVLNEFCKDITKIQLPTIAPIILSELHRILDANNVYRSRTRAQAVEVFLVFTEHIFLISASSKGLKKTILWPYIPQFIDLFVTNLTNQENDNVLKVEIVKAVYLLTSWLNTRRVHEYMPHIFLPMWNIFKEETQHFQNMCINDTVQDENGYDIEGVINSLLKFVSKAIAFQCHQIVTVIPELLSLLLILMKFTQADELKRLDDPDVFIEDERCYIGSIRLTALDIFLKVCETYQDIALPALTPSIAHFIQTSEHQKSNGDPNWWKGHEATMLAIESIRLMLFNNPSHIKSSFNFEEYLTNIMSHFTAEGCYFLVGRCMRLTSICSNHIAPSVLEHSLVAVEANLMPNRHPVLRISACRAIIGFCDNMFPDSDEYSTIFIPRITTYLSCLIDMCNNLNSKGCAEAIEAMSRLLTINGPYNLFVEQKVIPLIVTLFGKYDSDPDVSSAIESLAKNLMLTPLYHQSLLNTFIPHLVSVLNNLTDNVGAQSVALEMLRLLVRSSKPPLNNLLIGTAFTAAVQCILRTDDQATMQSGGECLRSYLDISPSQVCSYNNGECLGYIVQVATQLLDPNAPESAAVFIGKLVITLITKAGNQLGEHVDTLLKSVLSKMHRVESLSVIMSLVIIFAHLFLTQIEAVLNFLSTVPGPTGEPAINYVLNVWLTNQHMFYGNYELKVSTLALCKILEYIVTSNDNRIVNIKTTGDLVIIRTGKGSGVQTRSQTDTKLTEIPVTFKIFKLLLSELDMLIENVTAKDEDISDEESPGLVSDSDESDSEFTNANKQVILSELLGPPDEEDEPEDDDNDGMSANICQMNTLQHLKDFVYSFVNNPSFPAFIEYLNNKEKRILRILNINI